MEGNDPLLLVDPSRVYVTIAESQQLFCVGHDGVSSVGRREHVASCEPGQLLLAMEGETALLLTGARGSRVLAIPTSAFLSARERPGGHEVVEALLDGWMRLLTGMVPEEARANRESGGATFHAFVIGVLGRKRKELEQARIYLDAASHRAERQFLDESLRQLASVGSDRHLAPGTSGGGSLARACSILSSWLAIPMPRVVEPEGVTLSLMERALSLVTGVRTRPVLLEGRWWESDNGALLGFVLGDDESIRPIALLPSRRGYDLHDPEVVTPVRVTRLIAQTLHPRAQQFYASLPARPLGPLDVLRFASRRARGDLAFVVGLGMTIGALGMLLPLLTSLVFDRLIPSAERGLLVQLTLVLVAIAGGQVLFDAARALRLVRAETRMDTSLEAAVWDRLLALPLPFFRDYTAGDLAARAGGIGAIRQVLSGAVLSVMLGMFFSMWNVAFLFWVSARLALAACALVAVAAAVAALASWASLRRQRTVVELDGQIGGLLLQLLGGIAKLRVTGSEDRAFGVWSRLFARRRDAHLGAG